MAMACGEDLGMGVKQSLATSLLGGSRQVIEPLCLGFLSCVMGRMTPAQ